MWTTTEETTVEDEFFEEDEFLRNEIEIEALENLYDEKCMIRYIRNNQRQKRGVLVATNVNHKIIIGWSLCCNKDEFDADFGKEMAIKRGVKHYNNIEHFDDIPESIEEQVVMFIDRCERYYKEGDFPLWI